MIERLGDDAYPGDDFPYNRTENTSLDNSKPIASMLPAEGDGASVANELQPEADITVNGTKLTPAQSMTVRVALEMVAMGMLDLPSSTEDEAQVHKSYRQLAREIVGLILSKGPGMPPPADSLRNKPGQTAADMEDMYTIVKDMERTGLELVRFVHKPTGRRRDSLLRQILRMRTREAATLLCMLRRECEHVLFQDEDAALKRLRAEKEQPGG